MMRKHSLVFGVGLSLLVGFSLLSAGCGGGGGGGSTGGGGITGTIFAEDIFGGHTAQSIDPLNIQVGDTFQFVLASYDTTGVRTVNRVGGWSTTDTLHTVGTLGADGTLTIMGSSANTYTARVTYNSVTYSVSYKVNPVQARFQGTVLKSGTTTPIPGIKLFIYDSGGGLVGSVTTSYDGKILASVPTTAKRFNIDDASIDSTAFYSSFTYNTLRYSPLIASCTAPLPTLASGATVSLNGNVTIPPLSSVPPGPPTGCSL